MTRSSTSTASRSSRRTSAMASTLAPLATSRTIRRSRSVSCWGICSTWINANGAGSARRNPNFVHPAPQHATPTPVISPGGFLLDGGGGPTMWMPPTNGSNATSTGMCVNASPAPDQTARLAWHYPRTRGLPQRLSESSLSKAIGASRFTRCVASLQSGRESGGGGRLRSLRTPAFQGCTSSTVCSDTPASSAGLAPWGGQRGVVYSDGGRFRLIREGHPATIAA